MECACLPWISARNVNRDSHKYFDFAVRHQLSWPRHLRSYTNITIRIIIWNKFSWNLREREREREYTKVYRIRSEATIKVTIKGEGISSLNGASGEQSLDMRPWISRPTGGVCTHWLWSTRARGNVASAPIGRKHLYSSRRGAACVYDNRLW